MTNFAATAMDPILSQLSVEHTQEMEAGTLVFGHHAVQRGYTHKVRLVHPFFLPAAHLTRALSHSIGAPSATHRKNAAGTLSSPSQRAPTTTPLPAQLNSATSRTHAHNLLTSPQRPYRSSHPTAMRYRSPRRPPPPPPRWRVPGSRTSSPTRCAHPPSSVEGLLAWNLLCLTAGLS